MSTPLMTMVDEHLPVINPANGKELSEHYSEVVRDLRRVRRGARQAARSGNPAKRNEAINIGGVVPGMIRKIYSNQI